MKKIFKTAICLLICLSMILSMTSCEWRNAIDSFNARAKAFYGKIRNVDSTPTHVWHEGCVLPNGYTGGAYSSRRTHFRAAFIWFETVDELNAALDLTRAHGTEIPQTPYFDCEEYGIDIKFLVTFPRRLVCDGRDMREQTSMDQKINYLKITAHVFFEDVSIEELEYSYYNSYDGFSTEKNSSPEHQNYVEYPSENAEVTIYSFEHEDMEFFDMYAVNYDGVLQFALREHRDSEHVITEEEWEIFKKTISIIE